MTQELLHPETAAEQNTNAAAMDVFLLPVDIWESDDEIVLYGEMPGVEKDDLSIRFENRQLIIDGKVAPRQQGLRFVGGEYGVGHFHRTFTIGEAINADNISAELRNGVLTLRLPKSEAVKPRKIQVKAG